MKWITHQTVAAGAAILLGMGLPAAGLAAVGAIVPDWIDQRLAALAPDRQKAFNRIHRGWSHWFGWWLGVWLVGASPSIPPAVQGPLAGLGFGALLHVVLDMCTVTGVPLLPWSRKGRVSLKLCRTGGWGEYLFLATFVALFCSMQGEQIRDAGQWLMKFQW